MKKEKHVLQWHITHQCNLRCKHCYQDEYKKDLRIQEMEDVFYKYLKYITDNNLRGHINFTGGEPFFYTSRLKLFFMMKLCDNNDITYGILTNGTYLDEGTVVELKQLKNLKFIQMSLEGGKRINDSIRGKGNYKKVMEAVKRLNQAGIETMISFTMHDGNYKELRKLIWLCRLHGVKRFWTDRYIPIKENIDVNDNNIKPITTEHFEDAMRVLGEEQRRPGYSMKVHANRAMQFKSGCGEFYECSAGRKLIAILAGGEILPCRRLPFNLGNILGDDSIETILKENKNLIDAIHDPSDKCISCGIRSVCGGGAKCLTYAVKGTLNDKDVNCSL